MGLRVLVADDHAAMRRSVRLLLEADSSLQVIGEAANGQEAMEKTAELQPDLIVLDITMPKIDGLEVARRVRNMNPRAEIIAFTHLDSVQNDSRGTEGGSPRVRAQVGRRPRSRARGQGCAAAETLPQFDARGGLSPPKPSKLKTNSSFGTTRAGNQWQRSKPWSVSGRRASPLSISRYAMRRIYPSRTTKPDHNLLGLAETTG